MLIRQERSNMEWHTTGQSIFFHILFVWLSICVQQSGDAVQQTSERTGPTGQCYEGHLRTHTNTDQHRQTQVTGACLQPRTPHFSCSHHTENSRVRKLEAPQIKPAFLCCMLETPSNQTLTLSVSISMLAMYYKRLKKYALFSEIKSNVC